MKKIFSLLGGAFTYFCIATVIALATAIAALASKGALDQERLYRVLAAMHGIDVVTMQQQLVAQEKEADTEQPSHQAWMEQQTHQSLDQDLRNEAISNALVDMKTIQTDLEVETARFEDLKKAYAAKLQQFANEEQANSLKELQRTLEAIKPAQAKEQLVKMLDDDAMDDVVTIMKSMAIDKRKKIIAEFKIGPDTDALYDILKNIRQGEPIASQIRDTQKKLSEFGGNQ